MKDKKNKLISKQFIIYNINNSILTEFIIKHTKTKNIKSKTHFDGSYSPTLKMILVSENGYSWYRYFGNHQGGIKKNSEVLMRQNKEIYA